MFAENFDSKELSDKDLYKLCQEYGLNARKWMKKFASLLPEVARRKLYFKHGMHSIYEFAAKLGGMSNNAVDRVLQLERKLKDKPELKKLIPTEGWSKLRVVASVATVENEKILAEKVKEQSKSTLETFVKECKKEGLLKSVPGDRLPGKTANESETKMKSITFKVSEDTESELRILKQKLEKKAKQSLSWEEVMKEMLKMCEEETKKAKEKNPKPVPTKEEIQKSLPEKSTRYIPARVKIYIKQKHKNRCAYPNCNRPYEILRHTKRFKLDPNHDPDYLQPLCKNHERLAHHGLIKNEEEQPSNWKVQLQPYPGPKAEIDKIVNRFRRIKTR